LTFDSCRVLKPIALEDRQTGYTQWVTPPKTNKEISFSKIELYFGNGGELYFYHPTRPLEELGRLSYALEISSDQQRLGVTSLADVDYASVDMDPKTFTFRFLDHNNQLLCSLAPCSDFYYDAHHWTWTEFTSYKDPETNIPTTRLQVRVYWLLSMPVVMEPVAADAAAGADIHATSNE
jgi:hypothetical protein